MAGIYSAGSVIARFVAPMSVTSNQPIFAADTLSLKQKTGTQAEVQRWEIKTQLEPLIGDPSLFLHMIVNDSDTVFDVEMPQMYRRNLSAATTATSSLSVSGPLAVGNRTINVANNAGTRVAAGEFIKFANHNKVYLVTSGRVGNGAISIFPGLVAGIITDELIKTGPTAVLMKARYDTSTIKGMSYTDGVLMDVGQVTLIEAL